MESNHHSTRHRVYSAGSSPVAQRPRTCTAKVADRVRTGADGAHNPGCFRYTTATTKAGTTGLEPAASRLTSECSARLSYAPEECAGGIRTHGLELMRLARTAAPLPRKSGRQESNLRSPAPEAGGVPNSPTARRRSWNTPGGTRTRSFRVEGPASSPLRPRGHLLSRKVGIHRRGSPPRKIPEAGRSRGRAWSRPGASLELRRQGSNLRSRG
jgi:hypothetical protein